MDPITVVQIVGAAISLSDVVVKCIAGLRSIKSRYHEAPLIICTIIGQLCMVQVALDQLALWNKPEYGHNLRYKQLARQIDDALECFNPLILALERRLDDFKSNSEGKTATIQRLIFLWSEEETSDYSILLDRQVNALNLLLQAVQCNTFVQQQSFLHRVESRSVLQLARDCSSSIKGLLDDSASSVSETTAGISLMFDFDAALLASNIYRRAGHSHLRNAIRAERSYGYSDRPPLHVDEPSWVMSTGTSPAKTLIQGVFRYFSNKWMSYVPKGLPAASINDTQYNIR